MDVGVTHNIIYKTMHIIFHNNTCNFKGFIVLICYLFTMHFTNSNKHTAKSKGGCRRRIDLGSIFGNLITHRPGNRVEFKTAGTGSTTSSFLRDPSSRVTLTHSDAFWYTQFQIRSSGRGARRIYNSKTNTMIQEHFCDLTRLGPEGEQIIGLSL